MNTSMRSSLKIFLIVFFLITAVFVRNSLSQEHFPNRPLTMIGGFTAGLTDTLIRSICKAAGEILGQPYIIEVKAGAAGLSCVNYVLKSKPDGYTIGVTGPSTYITLPHMMEVPYNPFTDITEICSIWQYNFGLCVRSDSPFKTYEDIIAYSKKNPGKFTYATPGVGMTQHICMERMAAKEGIKWTAIPTKSGGESVLQVLGGHVNACAPGTIDINPHIKAGTLRMLLILDDRPRPEFPNVPLISEKGYNFSAFSHGSFLGPAGMPEPRRQKLEDTFKEAMKDPSFTKLCETFQVDPTFMTGKKYREMWTSQYDDMGKAIRAMGLGKEQKK